MLEKQKLKLHSPTAVDERTLVSSLWELFIILMIGGFLVSILNSVVRNRLDELDRTKTGPNNLSKNVELLPLQKPKRDC
jgi:hypothetical protein